ncbi:MAG: energy-coupling factor transporter transmembrane protein EcfT, partial [Lachnospiraceae bacterium]|nr:energy-coupling factor transporter transmembrane protein EcfT [Lachnospiraceae bacterium]
AMESRCYQGGEGRTKMYPLHYEKRDWVAYVVVLLYLFFMIVLKIITNV